MNTGFRLFPEQASTEAQRVDQLYAFLLAVTAFFVILICASILYFGIKYRRSANVDRSNPRTGNLTLEAIWTAIPLVLTMIMFFWGAKLYFDVHRPPPNAVEVDVVAKQWMWKLQQPEGKSEINALHLPVGRPVKLRMISEDVIHSFFVPAFRIKMDVLPGRYTSTWFLPTKVGTFHLFCAEYCGTSHSKMIGQVIVQEPDEFADWLQGATGEAPAVVGQRLFEQFRCNTCHTGKPGGRCPPLQDVFGSKVPLQNGAVVTADENYIRESIINPSAKVVAGYQPVMPTFKGQIGEEGILQLIAYLKSLAAQPKTPAGPSNEQRQ
jgi:cytochrome c oxidase subunit 2